ncbi:MAG: HlyC/CorC family transporter [Actinobacteria bacterium]|nr:HlyC/CorC family transporter [Actinomycetota bacterium]
MTYVALLVSGFLVVLTAIVRAAGASLVRTPRADALHDAGDGDKRAAAVAEMLNDRSRLQPALGMTHTLFLVAAAVPASWALTRLERGANLAVALVLFGLVLAVFGDLLPRTLGRNRPALLAYRFAWLLKPAIAIGDAASDLVTEFDDDQTASEPDDDEDDRKEKELISSVLDFTDTIVREVMTPRPDMISIAGTESTDAALDLVIAEGRSRVPVVGEDVDHIEGVLYARDLLKLMDNEEDARLCSQFMRPAYFVPETKRVSELLRDMQTNQVHLAIVVDEFGGTAGLVTIEDLLEELVGEIVDEYDDEEPMVEILSDDELLVDARLDVDALSELTDTKLPAEEFDTVGGLVLDLAGRVPREGEAFTYQGLVLVADQVQGRRVSRVRISKQ